MNRTKRKLTKKLHIPLCFMKEIPLKIIQKKVPKKIAIAFNCKKDFSLKFIQKKKNLEIISKRGKRVVQNHF